MNTQQLDLKLRRTFMAHLVETMAFVGQTPWHGLGNQLTPNQPLEVWAKQKLACPKVLFPLPERPIKIKFCFFIKIHSTLSLKIAPLLRPSLDQVNGLARFPERRHLALRASKDH